MTPDERIDAVCRAECFRAVGADRDCRLGCSPGTYCLATSFDDYDKEVARTAIKATLESLLPEIEAHQRSMGLEGYGQFNTGISAVKNMIRNAIKNTD